MTENCNIQFDPYDDQKILSLIQNQKAHHLDFNQSPFWHQPLSLNLPLVPLDKNALLLPHADQELRLVLSQFMGLLICVCIYELEDTLLRFKTEAWENLLKKHPVSKEFFEYGSLFYEEELKHSTAFRKYVIKYAHDLGLDLSVLLMCLPKVENTKTEKLLKKSIEEGGRSFWWIVALVEQQFFKMYFMMSPFKSHLEPLHFDLHKKHFEEEARHAAFPYYVLELLKEREKGLKNKLFHKADLGLAQFLQSIWAVDSLKSSIQMIQKNKNEHPFLQTLSKSTYLIEKQPIHQILWNLFTRTPYVSSLINPSYHLKILKFAQKDGSFIVPFPKVKEQKLVGY